MAGTTMQQRRGTAAAWSTANPVLANGELGVTSDTGVIKIGDGVNNWNALPNALDTVLFRGATDLATPNQLVKRNANGNASFNRLFSAVAPTTVDELTRKDYVDAADDAYPVNYQSGTAYTTLLSDAGSVVRMNNAAAMTVTIPPNSSVPYPVGAWIEVERTGAGVLTIAPGSGVTINSPDGNLTPRASGSRVRLHQVSANNWYLSGDNNDTTASTVAAASVSAAANSLVKRDANGGGIFGYTQIDRAYLNNQAVDPGTPGTAGQAELWKATDKGLYVLSQDAPTKRRLMMQWPSATAFPTVGNLPGDMLIRTDIGTNGSTWLYTPNGWRLEEVPEVANATARTAIPAATLYKGFRVRQTDSGNTWEWNGTAWKSVPDSSFPVAFAHQTVANSNMPTGWHTVSLDVVDADTHSAFTTGTAFDSTTTSKFTVPAAQDGMYALEGAGQQAAPNTASYNARIIKNNSTILPGQGSSGWNNSGATQACSAGTGRHLVALVAGDVIQLQIGGSMTVSTAVYADACSWLSIERIR